MNHDRGGSQPSRFDREGSGARSTGTRVVLEVVHTAFHPPELRVEVGRDVTWKQTEAQPHSVTAVDGSFDSHPGCGLLAIRRCMAAGDVFSHSFDEPGTYKYYCRVHGLPDGTGMTGVIAVTG